MRALCCSQVNGEFRIKFISSGFVYVNVLTFFLFFFSLNIRTDYFRNFVDSCLQKIPQDRPNSEELLKVRIRKWF